MPPDWIAQLPTALRILLIIGLAVAGHLLVQGIRWSAEHILAPARSGRSARMALARRYPKIASVTSLLVSGLTFSIYFVAVGFLLRELGISLTAYLATASIAGLAVAFGLQGLIQDIVIGVTMLFTDVFDIGDLIEVAGQVGRVDHIGLRFTILVNLHGQRVYIPNRNIGTVARFRGGAVRAYVDVQVPKGADPAAVRERVSGIASGMRAQHAAILLRDPELVSTEPHPAGWQYLRFKFRLWPGQGSLLETVFRQRVVTALQELDPGYRDWMVNITYRV